MIEAYIHSIALQMGVELSKVSLKESTFLGCRDTHSLMLSSKDCSFSTIIPHADLEQLNKGSKCDRLEAEVRQTLLRLQSEIET